MKIKTLILLSSILCGYSYADTNLNTMPKEVKLKSSDVSWLRTPRIDFNANDLKGKSREFLVRLYVNETGKVTQVETLKSTGLDALDRKISVSLRYARFKPYIEHGQATSFVADLPIKLETIEENTDSPSRISPQCKIELHSNVYEAQDKGAKTAFKYQRTLQSIYLDRSLFTKTSPSISITFTMKKNTVTTPDITLIESSGNQYIDEQIKQVISHTAVQSKKSWFPFFKMTATDQIRLDSSDCENN
ncbi:MULTISPECIES: energy transducer TonB [unclassified Acinetobacter]|uniref:energy transducer TonB n=1 Tax=unclassified Acinetobacter TaxID=196816 RepID=UPI0015D3B4EA|nr:MULTISPECIES: TonB family protein [unclassified Acinetobacter]